MRRILKASQLKSYIIKLMNSSENSEKFRAILEVFDGISDDSIVQIKTLRKIKKRIALSKNDSELKILQEIIHTLEKMTTRPDSLFDISQSRIADKIAVYLKKNNRPISIGEGYCNGLSVLWLYLKSLGKEQWLFDQLYKISQWNENDDISEIIEPLFNYLAFLQSPQELIKNISQQRMDMSIEVIKQENDPSLNLEFQFSFNYTREELVNYLKNIIHPNKLILLSSSDHSMGLYFKDQKYYLFDSAVTDLKQPEISFNDINELCDELFFRFLELFDRETNYLPLTTHIFDHTNQSPGIYPSIDDQLKELLKNQSINRQAWDGTTALLLSSETGIQQEVEFLLKNVANIFLRNSKGDTALHIAAENGQKNIITALIKNEKSLIEEKTENGATALYIASQHGHVSAVEELLSFGANPDNDNPRGISPLMMASVQGHCQVVDILINHHASLDVTNIDGATALHFAVSYQHPTIVKLLVDRGADPNKLSNIGKSPLHISASKGNLSLIQNLLSSKNIQINIKDANGSTPLMLAAGSSLICVNELLKAGADPTIVNLKGYTPLHFACANGRLDVIERLLLCNDVNINLGDDIHIDTPLNLALKGGQSNVVKYLLEHGAILTNSHVKSIDNPAILDVVKFYLENKLEKENAQALQKFGIYAIQDNSSKNEHDINKNKKPEHK